MNLGKQEILYKECSLSAAGNMDCERRKFLCELARESDVLSFQCDALIIYLFCLLGGGECILVAEKRTSHECITKT